MNNTIDTNALRQRILDLAMRGKLVPQDENDEPASVLLEKIKAEKDQLVKEKKIIGINTKRLTNISNIPYEIPENWLWVRLGEITSKVGAGNTPPGGKDSGVYKECGVEFIREMNVYNDGLVYNGMAYISPELAEKRKGSAVIADDILLNITGGSIGRCALIPENFALGNVNQHVLIIRMINSKCKEYIHYFLCSPFIQRIINHTAVGDKAGFSASKARNLPIAFPPIDEQKKITETIKSIFEQIDFIEDNQDSYDELRNKLKAKVLDTAMRGKLVPQDEADEPASVLLEKITAEKERLVKEKKIKKQKPLPPITADEIPFEIPFEIPESWEWARFQDIAILNPRNTVADNVEVSFIPMAYVGDGFSDTFQADSRKWETVKKGYTHIAEGDIGFAKITPCFQNRKSAIFKSLLNGYGAGTTELNIIRLIPNTLLSEYILMIVKSPYFINNGLKSFTGTVGQQRIDKEYFPKCLIPVPPLAEQKRIVAKIEEVFELLD